MQKLGAVVEIKTGFQFRGKYTPDPAGNWRVIQIKDFDESRKLDWGKIDRYKLATDPSRYLVGKADVIFLFRGVRLFAYAIDRDEANTLVSGHFYIMRCNPKLILPEFLAWYLNSQAGRKFIESKAKQTSHMPHIPIGNIEEMNMPTPALYLQKAIIELESLKQREAGIMTQISLYREKQFEAACLRAINLQLKG